MLRHPLRLEPFLQLCADQGVSEMLSHAVLPPLPVHRLCHLVRTISASAHRQILKGRGGVHGATPSKQPFQHDGCACPKRSGACVMRVCNYNVNIMRTPHEKMQLRNIRKQYCWKH